MKLTYISNFFNHHQKFISDALFDKCDSYYFIETEKLPEERKRLGYSTIEAKYLKNADEGIEDVIRSSDAIVFGSAPRGLIESEKKNKLIFFYSERPLKLGLSVAGYFPRLIKWHIITLGYKKQYLLCSSAFTAADYAKFGMYRNRAYKWGYFPETKIYDIDSLLTKKDPREIVWCGRFLDWKRPDAALAVAKKLKGTGCEFHLTIIGTGEMESQLKTQAESDGLTDCVTFTGALSPKKVREKMETAGVFLFTSNRREGWGAVLNEAMNSACAVVASDEIGSVPYLAKNNENALIYHSADIDALYQKTRYLLNDPSEQRRLGRAAYNTIISEWNAETAAERLIALSEKILDGDKYPDLYNSGPCSKAEIIKDNWHKED